MSSMTLVTRSFPSAKLSFPPGPLAFDLSPSSAPPGPAGPLELPALP
eukprot:CAMPEP_0175615314 /NCGR_PEP_ID=MMETSP0096-20121207/65304_1 /TAXON_ID=311494 /ORGANISM="Alexandrium monilatum, Strain CCMP3105" /LENGTH=46 /DNA_ID= /DNA_START= /DNA_END= /DNA_ORIENTATION=